MIIASHLLGDVEATCTHIAVVLDGRVVLAGRSDELLAGARIVPRRVVPRVSVLSLQISEHDSPPTRRSGDRQLGRLPSWARRTAMGSSMRLD